jgi:hypothetical protein
VRPRLQSASSCLCHRAIVSTYQIFWVLLSAQDTGPAAIPSDGRPVQQTTGRNQNFWRLCASEVVSVSLMNDDTEPGFAESHGWVPTTFPFAEPLAACIGWRLLVPRTLQSPCQSLTSPPYTTTVTTGTSGNQPCVHERTSIHSRKTFQTRSVTSAGGCWPGILQPSVKKLICWRLRHAWHGLWVVWWMEDSRSCTSCAGTEIWATEASRGERGETSRSRLGTPSARYHDEASVPVGGGQ